MQSWLVPPPPTGVRPGLGPLPGGLQRGLLGAGEHGGDGVGGVEVGGVVVGVGGGGLQPWLPRAPRLQGGEQGVRQGRV